MRNLFKRQDQARKSITKILLVVALGLAIVVCAILSAIFKVPDKVTEYAPNQTIVLSDTTNEWHDNFDSSFVYNGCLHLTNKKWN
jgi:flagellar basal body-associated protein FliL